MAIEAAASGDYLIRTTGGFYNPTAMTVAFWLQLITDKDASGAVFGIRNTGAGDGYVYYYNANADGTTYGWEHFDGGSTIQLDMTSLSLNTWYFAALSRSGTGANQTTAYRRAAGDSAFTSATGTFGLGQTINEEVILSNGFGLAAGYFPGRIAAVKQWDAALSADELMSESQQYAPVRFANLHSWRPMIAPTVADAALDFSGNGRNLTANGALTIGDGPPIEWRRGRRRIFLPSAAGGATINADARIFARSGLVGQSAVARVANGRINAYSGARGSSAVSRVAQAVIYARSGLAGLSSVAGQVLAEGRLFFRSSVSGMTAVARTAAARLFARSGLRTEFFTPLSPPVSVTIKHKPVTRITVTHELVTHAKVKHKPVTGTTVIHERGE